MEVPFTTSPRTPDSLGCIDCMSAYCIAKEIVLLSARGSCTLICLFVQPWQQSRRMLAVGTSVVKRNTSGAKISMLWELSMPPSTTATAADSAVLPSLRIPGQQLLVMACRKHVGTLAPAVLSSSLTWPMRGSNYDAPAEACTLILNAEPLRRALLPMLLHSTTP